MIIQNINIIDFGTCDYSIALEKQKELWQKRVDNKISDTLILVEHPAVFTIGKYGKIENLLVPKKFLDEKKIPLYQIERGGDITFHGPGQLVGYLIFKFNQPIIEVRNFIYSLENIICNTLKKINIIARQRHPFIGVWVEDKKIASIGIGIKQNVTFHGFALNVSTDISYFDWINPCGMKKIQVTSIEKEIHKNISIDQVKNYIVKEFISVFNKNVL